MTNMEYTVVDNTFRFFVHPYFLRLTFAENEVFVNDGTDYAQYDIEKSIVHVHVPKREKGQIWTDLNMITRLLQSSVNSFDHQANSSQQGNVVVEDALKTKVASSPAAPLTDNRDSGFLFAEKKQDGAKKEFSSDVESTNEASHLKAFNEVNVGGDDDNEDDNEDMQQSTKRMAPLIEVISEHNFEDDVNDHGEMTDEPAAQQYQAENQTNFDFSWEQTVPKPFVDASSTTATSSTSNRDSSLLNMEKNESLMMDDEDESGEDGVKIHKVHYGFNQQYTNFFSNYTLDLITEVIELPTPEETEAKDRTRMRVEMDSECFDVEHYLADLINDEMIRETMQFTPRFSNPKKKEVSWNEVEQTMLSNLPRRKYLIQDERAVYLSLLDILCSYCYNHRTFLGENNAESAWTISKMSCTLSWFEQFDSLKFCLKGFISRVLCYPLYRNFNLAKQCIRDAISLMRAGKSHILRVLLEIKYILEHSPGSGQYLLCKLYIDDYASWIQHEHETRFSLLANEVEETLSKITAGDFDQEFQLSAIERFAIENAEEMRNEMMAEMDNSRPVMM